MSGTQRHEARPNSQPSAKAMIESMIASGKSALDIMEATGKSRDYIAQLMGYHSRTLADQAPAADCERHIESIAAANQGRGFPVAFLPPGYRVRA